MLDRASLYFADTPVYGWNGSAWVDAGCEAALQPYGRPLSGADTGEKLRAVLTDPDSPIPSSYAALCFGRPGATPFLRGRTVQDILVSPYLDVTVAMMAELVGDLKAFNGDSPAPASGVPRYKTKTTAATYFCAREPAGSAADSDEPTIHYADTNIYLPSDALVNTDMEIQIGLDFYEIESVFNNHGLVACRCVTKRKATPHG